MFDAEMIAAVKTYSRRLGIEPAALKAVIEVESAGKALVRVERRLEPPIRFEGHYFDRRLAGELRERARRQGLAHPSAGTVANPHSQADRWAMLNRAILIDSTAALESTSWGLGQVMGAHWQWLGYASVSELVNTARAGVSGQIDLMVRYIEKAGLAGALKRRDWAAFARGYNGPAYARHGYHSRLAAAYRRHSRAPSFDGPSAEGTLRMSSKGARVRELQQLLVRAGHPVTVDGDFGPATDRALRAFQAAAGIEIDGVAGPQTMRALDRFRQGAGDRPGALAASEVGEVREAGRGAVGAGLLAAMRDQIAETAAALAGLESAAAQSIADGLLAGAGALGVGLAAWALYGWWKSRRTIEAPA